MAKKREKRECKPLYWSLMLRGSTSEHEEIYVAVPPDRDEESYACSAASPVICTRWQMAPEVRIRTVGDGATGVYWISLFQILEARGLEVLSGNART